MKDFEGLSFKLKNNRIWILDQSLLPHREEWIELENFEVVAEAIQALRVRGAPLIGLVAASFLQLQLESGLDESEKLALAKKLEGLRPTAVNLKTCLARILAGETADQLIQEDVLLCQKIANAGARLIQDGDNILTICNTGALATAGVGTAFGAIAQAHRDQKKIHVWVSETRPLLQGGRLTTYECEKAKIPYTLLSDNMAASLMQQGKVDRVMIGADRIARNGDSANKIGSYSLAVLAKAHQIPFCVLAPKTTYDEQCASQADIEIEQRSANEVRREWAPQSAPVYNPAFDVVPAELISHWVIDSEILQPPFEFN